MNLSRKAFTVVLCICLFLSAIPCSHAMDLIIEYDPKTYTYDEYEEFLKSTDLPDDFVFYSDLSHFGELGWFSHPRFLDFDAYHYFIIDKKGYDFFIDVKRKYEIPEYIDKYPLLDASQINPSDMRTLPSGDNGRYVIANITYWYQSGRLTAIRWHQNGMHFELGLSESRFAEYPLDANTTIAKLLRIKNRSAAELSAILQGKFISPWIYIASGTVLIIATSAAILLWRRRKKQCSPPQ